MKFVPCLAAVLSLSVAQAETIDQSAPTNSAGIVGFRSDVSIVAVQSFQQSAANVSGAGFFIQPRVGSPFTGAVTIALYDKLPNNGGALLTQGSGTAMSGNWFDLHWSPASVVPESTYFLVVTGDAGISIAGDLDNGYARGQFFASVNGGTFQSFPQYDLSFRTYSEVAAVPELQTYALMLVGLTAIGVATARRKMEPNAY